MLRRPLMLTALLAGAMTTLAACGDTGNGAGEGGAGGGSRSSVLSVVDGTVRMGATADRPAAAYFTIRGGMAPVDLVAAESDVALRTEMHETVKEGGMVQMKPITRVVVPPRGEVKFQPGGKHVMLFGVDPRIAERGSLPMTFLFSNNVRIAVDMKLEPADTAAAAKADPAAAKGDAADPHAGH